MVTSVLILLIGIILGAFLNRLRGSGLIPNVTSGSIVYAFAMAGYFYYINPVWWMALLGFSLFKLGESSGWGKWVGVLCYPKRWSSAYFEKTFEDKEGYGFPWIHHIANFFVKEKEKPIQFNQLALTIRGIWWWAPTLFVLAYFTNISYVFALISSIIIGILFPISCWLGSKVYINWRWWKIRISNGWEAQEVIYGAFQGLLLGLVLVL